MAAPDDTSTQNTKGKQVEAEPARAQPAEGPAIQNGIEKTAQTELEHASMLSPSETSNGRASAAGDDVTASRGQVPTTLPQPPAPPSETHQAPLMSTATHKMDDSDRSKETEKDKGSLDTTLAGTATRRKDAKSASEGAHTVSSTGEHPNGTQPRTTTRRRARFMKEKAMPPSPPKAGASTSVLKEKQAAKEAEELPPPPLPAQESPSPPPHEPVQTQPAESSSMPPQSTPSLQPLTIPAQEELPSAPSVIIPPTPTKSLLPQDETEGMTSGAVQPPGSTGEEGVPEHAQAQGRESGDESDGSTSFTEDEELDEGGPLDDVEDEEERLIMNGGAGIPIGPDGVPRPLLPPISPKHAGRKCLVLDLDETLVHSSFKSIQQADYVVPVEIEYHWHNVYVIKRPGVDNFLKRMGEIYEVVVFTASLSKYADPVLDKLDIHHVVSHRLFRESCYNHRGNYVKDLSQLGRPISDMIIIDNSPASYIFHPNNAVPVSSWFNDPHDTELTDLCPFLADLGQVDDVRGVLDGGL